MQNIAFEYVIMVCIILNTILLCADHYHATYKFKRFLEICNLVFVVIFTIEMVLKISAYGIKYYWHVNWNKFDCIIVVLSIITLFLDNSGISTLRFIRATRLLRMVK